MKKRPQDNFLEEAKRLAQLPPDEQRAVVAMYQQLARNPLATKACRADAERKAKALAKLLGLGTPGRKKKS